MSPAYGVLSTDWQIELEGYQVKGLQKDINGLSYVAVTQIDVAYLDFGQTGIYSPIFYS